MSVLQGTGAGSVPRAPLQMGGSFPCVGTPPNPCCLLQHGGALIHQSSPPLPLLLCSQQLFCLRLQPLLSPKPPVPPAGLRHCYLLLPSSALFPISLDFS